MWQMLTHCSGIEFLKNKVKKFFVGTMFVDFLTRKKIWTIFVFRPLVVQFWAKAFSNLLHVVWSPLFEISPFLWF